ncbi:OpgC domain-containing protein [Paracoccus luteus]|uniref:OpgC domain-containing protein n=1 Tax=Paracoccus luteus TaxID=2508543 RepID=UPI001FE3C12D|nr:OpgC domain-containing protein [Paracoccus luteus]
MTQPAARIGALDMLRGYALACIMLDHMPLGVLRMVTLTNFAIFDAAELFVLLSGFLVGMVWTKVQARQGLAAAQWRFFRRAGQVWLALVIGGVLLALLSRGLSEAGLVHTAVWFEYGNWVIDNPLGYLGTLALLWMQPNLLDVLALYVILLALAPATVPVLLRWPWRFAAGSLALWAVAVPLNAALPNQRVEGGLLFNPFGWQMLFHAGVAMGLFRHRFMPALRRHAAALTLLAAVVTIYSLGMVTLWRMGPDGKRLADAMWHAVGSVDKWSLDWVRFAAIMAASWLVAVPLSGLFSWAAATGPGRALAVIGRGGLVSFVACVLLSVLGDAMAMTPPGAGWGRLLAVDLWVIAALWLVALVWLRIKARRAAVWVADS